MEADTEGLEIKGRSFLTDSQRQFAVSDEKGEYSASQTRQHRYNIRQNLQAALVDLSVLWQLRERDEYLAFAPLSKCYGVSEIAETADASELGDINIDDADAQVGQAMHQGIIALLAHYAIYYGAGALEETVQDALDAAVAQESVNRDEQMQPYQVSITQSSDAE